MEQNHKISIIVPAYNVEKYISQCLESLVNQTYKNIEIIVINDGSTDGTLNIIQKYESEDKRFHIINQDNCGPSESRNLGISIASGEYIMFVDADDWVEINMCEVCLKELQQENADLVMFSYIREYKNNSILKSQFEDNKIIFKDEDVKLKIQRRIFGPYEKIELAHPEKLDSLSTVWGKLYKSSKLKRYRFRPFEEIGATCGEDLFFNAESLAEFNKAIFIDEHLYHYRKYNINSLTRLDEEDLLKKWTRSYDLLKEIIANNNYDASYSIALNNRFAINLIAMGQRIIKSHCLIKSKYNMINNILNDKLYKSTCKELDISSMPLHWRIFFKSAKMQNTLMVFTLLYIISKLASKK